MDEANLLGALDKSLCNSSAKSTQNLLAIDCECIDGQAFEIAIIDRNECVQAYCVCKPDQHVLAQSIRPGLPTSILEVCLPLSHHLPFLKEVVSGHELVTYNSRFEQGVLPSILAQARSVHCGMERFKSRAAKWSSYHQDYQWVGLRTALKIAKIEPPTGPAHRAIPDAIAALRLWLWLEGEDSRIRQSIGNL